MSELLTPEPPTLAQYEQFIVSSRKDDISENDNFGELYADFLQGEQIEFLMQHGSGALLLLPPEFGVQNHDSENELRFHMADEMGDILWFGAASVHMIGSTIAQSVGKAVTAFGIPTNNYASFDDIESEALIHAGRITFPNKHGLLFPDFPQSFKQTSLQDNPFYAFTRSIRRVTRMLQEGKHDQAPFSATELEQVQDPETALGTLFLTLAYISKAKLNIAVSDVAAFNTAKLQNRQLHGKENDIHFDASFIRS